MKTGIWLIGLSTLYIIACALPALGPSGSHSAPGITCLIVGFLWHPAWWANPLFFAGCVALAREKNRLAAKLGLIATFLAVGFGLLCRFEGFQIGAYFWMASMVGLTAAGVDDSLA